MNLSTDLWGLLLVIVRIIIFLFLKKGVVFDILEMKMSVHRYCTETHSTEVKRAFRWLLTKTTHDFALLIHIVDLCFNLILRFSPLSDLWLSFH